MNTKTAVLALVALGGAGYLFFRSKGSSNGPLAQATTFHYVFDGVTQDFTQEQLDTFAQKVEEQSAAFGVEFSELPSDEILFAFTLPAGATPPPRVIRAGTMVARRKSALPAVEA